MKTRQPIAGKESRYETAIWLITLSWQGIKVPSQRMDRTLNRKEQNDMKYILMMNATKAEFDWYATWPKEDLQANFAFMHAFKRS